MKTSLRRIALACVLSGAVMVSVHTVGMLALFCAEGAICLADVHSGLYTLEAPAVTSDFSSPLSTPAISSSQSITFADVHVVVQATGLYLLLVGLAVLLVLEIFELRSMGALAHYRRRKKA